MKKIRSEKNAKYLRFPFFEFFMNIEKVNEGITTAGAHYQDVIPVESYRWERRSVKINNSEVDEWIHRKDWN